jgi:hypothetical protein
MIWASGVMTSQAEAFERHHGEGDIVKRYGTVGVCALLVMGLTVGSFTAAGAQGTSGVRGHGAKVGILMFGDSVALTLGWSLNQKDLAATYGYTFKDLGIVGCGVVMGPFVTADGQTEPSQPACNGAAPLPGTPLKQQPWPVQWKDELAEYHPNVVVLLAGRWEEVDREFNGTQTNILDPTFADYVRYQLTYASLLVTSTGANMVFLTAPCNDAGKQLDGAPWPEDEPSRLAAYNHLVRQVAAEFPTTDSVVDLDSLVCPGGKFSATFRHTTIRDPDGVHFTLTAGITLAPELMPPIVAAGRAQMSRMARLARMARRPTGKAA